VAELVEDGSDFNALLGSFGSHANIKKRAKAERKAALKPTDGRRMRVAVRTNQFNARISDEALALAQKCIDAMSARDSRKWSQADLVEAAIAAFAKAEKIKGAA
jgi:hypothetical protein